MELVVGICRSTESSLLSLAFGLPKHIIFVTSPGLCSLFLVRLNSSVSVFVLSEWYISLSSSKVASSLISRLEFPSFGQSSSLINVEPLKIQKRYNAQGLKILNGAYKLFTTPNLEKGRTNFSNNFIISMYTYHIREDTCMSNLYLFLNTGKNELSFEFLCTRESKIKFEILRQTSDTTVRKE